jgi:transcription elongation GreA/GreB family factor
MSNSRTATLTDQEREAVVAELAELRQRRQRLAADLETMQDAVNDLVDADAADEIQLAEELVFVDAEIARLNWILHGGPPESEVPGSLPDGTEVTVRFPDGEVIKMRMVAVVGADVSTDADDRTLTPDSPLGLALAGHRPGDTVTYETPYGPQQVELLAVNLPT